MLDVVSDYLYDDGRKEFTIGLRAPGHVAFVASYDLIPEADVITSVEIAWGLIPNGRTATLLVYADPDNTHDPSNAFLVYEQAVIIQNANSNFFNYYELEEPVRMCSSFFVGALVSDGTHAGTLNAPLTSLSADGFFFPGRHV